MSRPVSELHVVSHTHWDREWYHTAERFRPRLVGLIDELLDAPPREGESFLLDGQAILIEDYLAIRPDRAADVGALLRSGRLEAGPWHVLPDELIPSGEALVRNLLAGRDTLQRLGAQSPPVLYCPDSFGHPAILPDLAHGFGCAVVVAWRGYGGARWPAGDTVRWTGAGGSLCQLHHLPPDGYEFGSSLPTNAHDAAARWAMIHTTLAPRATLGAALLLNGADHHARQSLHNEAIGALAAAAAAGHDPCLVLSSSLRRVGQLLVDRARDADLPVITGELRDSYGYTWTLQGTLATRAAQKRRNAGAERALVRDVEPWLALLPDGASPSRRALLAASWRALLQAHPHDTLCGTSIDAVADAFDARLSSVESSIGALRDDALRGLLAHDAERARMHPSEWRRALVLRNPVARQRGGIAEVVLRATITDVAVGPGSATRQGERREPAPFVVEGVAIQLLEQRECVQLTESPRAYPDADLVAEARAVAWVPLMGGYTVETRLHADAAPASTPTPVVATERSLDNNRLRVSVTASGEVTLHEHATGREVTTLLKLEQARDVGDLYTPAIREILPAPVCERVELTHRGPLRGELVLHWVVPSANSDGDGRCRIALQLDAAAAWMRVLVSGVNVAHDQRLRLVIATGLPASRTVADAAFHPVWREPLVVDEESARMEHVVPTAPLHRFVSRLLGDAGVTVCSDGLAEYESQPAGEIAVTLVRSVGELSRADLPERPGHAGWPAPTPGAQALGPYEAGLAVMMHGGESDATRDAIEQFAEDALLPITGETLRSNITPSTLAGGLELEGDGLAFSAALPARADGWITLRCVNRRDHATTGRWRIARRIQEACRARLDETMRLPLAVDDGTVAFTAEPREIVTILVR